MEQNERRTSGRVEYPSRGIAVACDTQTVIHMSVLDIGPGGAGIILPPDTPFLTGKDLILITDTMIIYADVIRQERSEDGSWKVGLAARRFSSEVLQYLLDSIEMRSKHEEGNDEKQI